MTTIDVKHSYELVLSAYHRPMVAALNGTVESALVYTLNMLYGLPPRTPAGLVLRYEGERIQLVEVAGEIGRVPPSDVLRGALLGALTAMASMYEGGGRTVYVTPGQVSDA